MTLHCSVWLVIAAVLASGPVPKADVLIAHLESPHFLKRADASRDLIELGYPAMPALRRARAGNPPLETRKRLDDIIAAIEEQDRPRTALHHLADQLQSASDDQLAEALYLLALSRPASAEERAEASRALAKGRPQAIDDLIVRLREAKDGDSTFLDARLRMIDLKRRMIASSPVPLSGLNDLAKELGPKLAARTREMTDEQELAALFLVALQRYPSAEERRSLLGARQRQANRQGFVEDIVWAMFHTSEFLRH